MKGNVAYSLGHLYNAISMYLLANRHLAYAATLESGLHIFIESPKLILLRAYFNINHECLF